MKEIKEFDDFNGSDGYVIVDSTDAETPGGKKLLSDIIPVASQATEGQVLTVNSQHKPVWDDVSVVPDLPADASDKAYVLGIKDNQLTWVELLAENGSGTLNVNYK